MSTRNEPRLKGAVQRSFKRKELARALAAEARIPRAAAQDQVDRVIHEIVQKLKAGRVVKLAGVGRLMPKQ